MKAILMSIRPQHLANILNGKKTIELRKRFPSDYRGWVYLYCTKGKPYLTRIYGEWDLTKYGCEESPSGNVRTVNGKVVCRFWVENVDKFVYHDDGYSEPMFIQENGDSVVFDNYKKRLIYSGMDCPPYFDEVKTQVYKVPHSWQYIYIED